MPCWKNHGRGSWMMLGDSCNKVMKSLTRSNFANHIPPPKTNMTKSKIHHECRMYFLLKKCGKISQPVIWVFFRCPPIESWTWKQPGSLPPFMTLFSGGLKRLVGFETPITSPKKFLRVCRFSGQTADCACRLFASALLLLLRGFNEIDWTFGGVFPGSLEGSCLPCPGRFILSFFLGGTIHMTRLDMGSKSCSIYVGELLFVFFTAELSILTRIYYDHSFFCRPVLSCILWIHLHNLFWGGGRGGKVKHVVLMIQNFVKYSTPNFHQTHTTCSARHLFTHAPQIGVTSTLPKLNMEPKNDGCQKESPIPRCHFRAPC